jgi:hypothetical protein
VNSFNSGLLEFDVFNNIGYLDTGDWVSLVKLKKGEASGTASYWPSQEVATNNKTCHWWLWCDYHICNSQKSNRHNEVNNLIKLSFLATWGVQFLQFSRSKIGAFTFPSANFIAQWSARACCQ